MDRKIKKKKWPPKKIAAYASAGLFIILVVYVFAFQMNTSSLNVQTERITISEVKHEPFQEHIPVIGEVLPIQTYFLYTMEGGRVEEIYMEAGSVIKKGDPILKLGNTNLLLDIMWREAELFQQSNNLRNTRLQMEQYRLQLNQDLARIENQLQQQKRTYQRYQELMKDNLISDHEFELSRDQFEYLQRTKALTIESQQNELEFRKSQVVSLEASLDRMQTNLQVVKQKQENLTLRAPISGHLTALSAEIGQSKAPSEPLGQIDVMDAFRVRVGIDEHYLARIEKGREGTFEFAGDEYKLIVDLIYLEVRDGRFEVDMNFLGKMPEGIRRGMSLHIRLELGDISDEIVLARGGFFQTTGGNWVFVVDNDGKYAVKRSVKLGMYNSYVFQVLEGLEPGEKVITSSYESFGNAERLILK